MTTQTRVSVDLVHEKLGWPTTSDIFQPSGAGPSVFAALVQGKIGRALQHFPDALGARFGVLTANPKAVSSEPPIAVVVEFVTDVSQETLRELHRLAWNFSHAPTLVTIEPTLLRVWTCCEAPDPNQAIESVMVHGLTSVQLHDDALEASAARALHWINLASGQFFLAYTHRFLRNGRADQALLRNLREIRTALGNQGLVDDDVCHDLLARIIFLQFLFDRRDQDGKAALSPAKLLRLHKEGVLWRCHSTLATILEDYDETYRLFDWLNTKFNGDLFPGKGDTRRERSFGWEREMEVVRPADLSMLADFVSGNIDMGSGQMSLWPLYAFDIIPLEFISSIYETFVTERAARDGIFYTPPYLVDFVLDQVLPWNSTDWDLKVLDPSCGSGVFLVKAFQRLVHRWKIAHPGEVVRAEFLRRILERNIFGVDKDPHAVRVACFSLYLAMCDEIEPRHYWTQVTFPSMRDRRLICSDFFQEDRLGFNSKNDAKNYDLIIGNAPWGGGVITGAALSWATSKTNNWTVPNKDVGGLFLAKSGVLVAETGRVALIQSANALLYNISPTAAKLRGEIFQRYTVEAIYNLSALRSIVFRRKSHTTTTSVAPACVVILNSKAPKSDSVLQYISPKHVREVVDDFTIAIEALDCQTMSVTEAATDPMVWSKLMWGNPRDQQLVKKLQSFRRLGSFISDNPKYFQQGINFGDRTKRAPDLDGWRMLDDVSFPATTITTIDGDALPIVNNVMVHSRASTALDAFSWPQMVIKQSWTRATGRFQARITSSKNKKPILCNQSYFSLHANTPILKAATLVYNSRLAVYYNFLTSGRFAAYRPKLSKDDILNLPLPEPNDHVLSGISSYAALDERTFEAFGLKDAERVLVEDLLDYTIPDFLGDGLGTKPTASNDDSNDEEHLRGYCTYFVRVLKAGFGSDKGITAIIFCAVQEAMPYRLVSFTLNQTGEGSVQVKRTQSRDLLNEMFKLREGHAELSGSNARQWHARVYSVKRGMPEIYMIKPDQKRFWTRSMGLHDGDAVSLDLFRLQVKSQDVSESCE